MQSGWAEPVKWDDRKEISRTKDGLLFLSTGILLASIPFPLIEGIGSLLAIIGVLLIILCREAFGQKHSRNVLLSLIIYIAGVAITAAVTLDFASKIVSQLVAGASKNSVNAALSSSFLELLIGTFIGAAVAGFSQVLLSYGIQNRRGRRLLWIAYVATLAVGAVVFVLVWPQITSVVDQAFASGTYISGPVEDLQTFATNIMLLNIIPATIFALAYYSAVIRIRIGESALPSGRGKR